MTKRFPWKRYLLANWRDVRVLLRQFYIPLLLFMASILLGGLLFDLLYRHAQIQDLTYIEAVYAIFSMIFFGQSVPFPDQWYLQIFFFWVTSNTVWIFRRCCTAGARGWICTPIPLPCCKLGIGSAYLLPWMCSISWKR